jgi:hypothetical protein
MFLMADIITRAKLIRIADISKDDKVFKLV